MKIISMILLTSLTLPLAYAMPATGTKVIHVKQWATNDAKVNFRVVPTVAGYSENNSKYARVTTKTEAQQGTVNTPKTYSANSAFDFYNDSDQTETVTFSLDVCIYHNDDNSDNYHYRTQCGYYRETVSVPAHDHYSKDFTPELITNFAKAGVYQLESMASYYSKPQQKGFFSNASANITISD